MGVTGWALSPWKFARGAQLPAAPGGTPLPGQVLTTDLGGTAWTLQQAGENEKLPAQVPGDHYSDLLRAGKISDPYFRDNNQAVQWAAKTGWVYQRTFEVTPPQLAVRNVELVCQGLDTFATLTLNGVTLGSTDNMFRTWVFDVRRVLKPGTNDLQIRFQPLPEQAEVDGWTEAYFKKHPEVVPDDEPHDGQSQSRARSFWHDRSWVRKAAYQWGWDWCRPLLTWASGRASNCAPTKRAWRSWPWSSPKLPMVACGWT